MICVLLERIILRLRRFCDVYLGMDESIYPCIILPLVYIGGGEERTSNWQTCTEL
jgi:hypothetical protein